MLKNIINYIKKTDNIKILKELYCDEKYISQKVSDFELFHAWESALPLMAGHRGREEYRRLLGEAGVPVRASLDNSVRTSCDRWRTLASLDGFCFSDAEYCPAPTAENLLHVCEKDLNGVYFNVNKSVTKNINISSDFFHLCQTVQSELSCLENAEKTSVILELSVDSCAYSRPNVYDARKAFDKIKCDEKSNLEQSFTILSEVLIDLLLHTEKKEGRTLHVTGDGVAYCGCMLVRYLYERSIFDGTVIVDLYPDSDTAELERLCDATYPRIRTIPMLIQKDCGEESFLRLFARYPVCAFLTDGIRADTSLYRALHHLSGEDEACFDFLCNSITCKRNFSKKKSKNG